jgi:hypothetical protein
MLKRLVVHFGLCLPPDYSRCDLSTPTVPEGIIDIKYPKLFRHQFVEIISHRSKVSTLALTY